MKQVCPILLLLLLLSGCMTVNTNALNVKVDKFEFIKANPFGQSFRVRMTIKNKGSDTFFLRILTYKVLVNGVSISTGEKPIWQDISGFSTRQVDLVISTNLWNQLKPILSSAKDSQEINYYLSGELIIGSLFFQDKVYINRSGVLTKDQMPAKKIKQIGKLIPNVTH